MNAIEPQHQLYGTTALLKKKGCHNDSLLRVQLKMSLLSCLTNDSSIITADIKSGYTVLIYLFNTNQTALMAATTDIHV